MKTYYEQRNSYKLMRRVPVIIRLDGKAFHTYTKRINAQKPFDKFLAGTMIFTARKLLDEIQGAKVAYVQSDEISILLTDFDNLNTDAWFDYSIQKIASVSASMATQFFMVASLDKYNTFPFFDSRVFNIPKEDVANYFIWRQQDWFRNSVCMYARSFFSHNELQNKSVSDVHEMLYGIGKNWATDVESMFKNGTCIEIGEYPRYDVIFQKERDTVERYLNLMGDN